MNRFLKIVITTPDERENESQEIVQLLENGIDYVHIRKPEWSESQIENLILSLPSHLYPQLKLHSHFQLINKYSLGGAHLNKRNSRFLDNKCLLSKSCHSLQELSDSHLYQYVTLSPIFDSISKSGYNAQFNPSELQTQLAGKNVIALGGVTPMHFQTLADYGFIGAAMLGYVWGVTSARELSKTLNCINHAPVYYKH